MTPGRPLISSSGYKSSHLYDITLLNLFIFRYLATGESYSSLAFQFRLGVTTISQIIPEVCDAIWKRMSPLYMKAPSSPEDWKFIAANFQQKWQFPFCLGAVDGKHVVMMKPWKSGSLYYNYKGTCSIVLMALVDANLQFIAIDTGSYGRSSDGGIFSRCPLGKRFTDGTFNFPPDDHFPGYEHIGKVPYVAVGDEAFPLLEHLFRPFPGRENTWEKQVFNYRLSRARRIVENAFGILTARFRVFHTKIAVSPQRANAVIKAACVLHNMLQRSSTPAMVTTLLQDAPELSGAGGLRNINHQGYHGRNDAVAVRNRYKQFFNEDDSCPWQNDHVRRGYDD